MTEFGVAMILDQLKSIPCQLAVYYVIIRRCGKLPNVNFKEWKDSKIYEGGEELSLWASLRKYATDFLELEIVSKTILGMVVLLCIVIFSELSLSNQIEESP